MSTEQQIKELQEEVKELKLMILATYNAIEKGNNPLSFKQEVSNTRQSLDTQGISLEDIV